MKQRHQVTTLAASALLCLTLTACSSDSSDDATNGAPIPSDFISATDAARAEDGLPQDFPRDQVPVVAGEVASAESGSPEGSFAVTVVTASSVEDATNEAIDLLEDAGWQNRSDAPFTGGSATVAQFFGREDDGLVILNVIDVGGEARVSYAVRIR